MYYGFNIDIKTDDDGTVIATATNNTNGNKHVFYADDTQLADHGVKSIVREKFQDLT
jgi:hypothetical protein